MSIIEALCITHQLNYDWVKENILKEFHEKRIRSQEIDDEAVKKDLHEVDEAIGDVATLQAFVLAAAKLLGAGFDTIKGGYIFKKLNMDH